MFDRAQDRPSDRQIRCRARTTARMTTSDSTDALTSLASMLTGTPGDWTATAGRVTYLSRAQVLALGVSVSRPIPGHIIEFGTWKGTSTRVIRDELWQSRIWDSRQRGKRIYACDSFKGLAEDYEHLKKGTFATEVPRLRGVRIVNGFFEDTLTEQLAREIGRISFAHLDADLYSSTLTALNWMTPLLQPGSVLLFDELIGEDPAEARAMVEWQRDTGVQLTMLALFGREPSGKGDMSDRRALFQVVGDKKIIKAPPLFPVRLRRRLAAKW
jgi:predicted O-methyltransferase YrrM